MGAMTAILLSKFSLGYSSGTKSDTKHGVFTVVFGLKSKIFAFYKMASMAAYMYVKRVLRQICNFLKNNRTRVKLDM